MKRHSLVCCLTVLLCLVGPKAAQAQWEFLDWLHELSGPGKFVGPGVGIDLACYGADRRESAATARWHPFCWLRPLDKTQQQAHFLLSVAFLMTDHNPYTYDPPKGPGDKEVDALPVMVAFDATLPGLLNNARLDPMLRLMTVGASVGAVRLSGDLFNPFWILRAEIGRITIKPLMLGASDLNGQRNALQVQVGAEVVGSVSPTDFGALPGPASGVHLRPSLRILVNLADLVLR
jgi:hypothetical protein